MSSTEKIPIPNRAKIIAEVGLTHEGSMGLALSISRGAIEAGADIIKFQAHFPEFESSANESFRVNFSLQDSSRWDYWQRTSFTPKEWSVIKDQVDDMGSTFAVSVFSVEAVKLFREMNVQIIKLGSGDLTNFELLEALADYSGTVLLSTGMARWTEIENAAMWLKSAKCKSDSAILQCTSKYPTILSEVGINIMKSIQQEFAILSGLSDHSSGLSASFFALSEGANYIEKHITISQYMFGPDIPASISLEELASIVRFRNDLDQLRQPVDKDAMSVELSEIRRLFGRSLGLRNNFPPGHELAIHDFCLRKPGGGHTWEERQGFVGKVLSKPYQTHEILSNSHISESKAQQE